VIYLDSFDVPLDEPPIDPDPWAWDLATGPDVPLSGLPGPLGAPNGARTTADEAPAERTPVTARATDGPVSALEGECIPLLRHRERYQKLAAEALFTERGISVQPWHWISVLCDEPICLNADHLIATAPRQLEYPARVCIYCGFPADTRDHLIPVSVSGRAARAFVLVVPACFECNSILTDKAPVNITDRRYVAHERLRFRYRKALATLDFTPAELREFGPILRKHIGAAMELKAAVLLRLNWPTDPDYDLKALRASGIDDPYSTGLISLSPDADCA
jgi:hypothetical protein